MVATFRHASSFNGYLPRETGQVVAFVRSKDEFAWTKFCQLVPTDFSLGTYTVIERDQFVRLPAGNDDPNAWEDGDYRPKQNQNKLRFVVKEFRTKRRDFGWVIGYKTLEQTKLFKIKPAHMAMAISQAMTGISERVQRLLQTASNWPSTNAFDVNALNGGLGKWSEASDDPTDAAHYNAILLTLQNSAQRINLLTNGKVKPTDLVTVLSPQAAIATAASAEIRNYVRESPAAKDVLEKGLDPQYQLWGLPTTYSGYRFAVSDDPIVTEHPSEAVTETSTEATTNRTRTKNDTTAYMVSRPGGLDGEYGAPSFSTVQIYHYGPLTQVEAFDEPKDRLVEGHVSTDLDVVLAAGVAGMHISNIL